MTWGWADLIQIEKERADKAEARIRVLEAALRAAEAVLRVIAKPESVVMKQVREALNEAK